MATNFAPSVGRVFIDADAYLGGAVSEGTYVQAKVNDIANALVATGEGWTISYTYPGALELAFVILERLNGGDKAQIVIAYTRSDLYIHADNQYTPGSTTHNRFHICYKPSTSGANIVDTGAHTPLTATFCSTGNSFKFAIVDYDSTFYLSDARFTWFADGERVILVTERPLHHPTSIVAMGPDVIDTFYNTGTAKWGGAGDIVHPQPDTYPELFYCRMYDSLTPGQDQPDSLQWYKTDGTWAGSQSAGSAIRGEWIQNATPNGAEPYLREPIVIFKNEYGAVWPDTGGATGNGLKGSIDMDFMSAVNAGSAGENLTSYQRLESGTFMHVADGLCIGWDPAFGPMPT